MFRNKTSLIEELLKSYWRAIEELLKSYWRAIEKNKFNFLLLVKSILEKLKRHKVELLNWAFCIIHSNLYICSSVYLFIYLYIYLYIDINIFQYLSIYLSFMFPTIFTFQKKENQSSITFLLNPCCMQMSNFQKYLLILYSFIYLSISISIYKSIYQSIYWHLSIYVSIHVSIYLYR